MQETQLEENRFLRAVLDAIPSLVFVVDPKLKIVDVNGAAKVLLEKGCALNMRRLCGDVMHCIHEYRSGLPCGKTEFCEDCIIRSVITGSDTTRSFYRQRYRMIYQPAEGESREAEFLVTATPMVDNDKALYLVVMEDVTELVALRHLATLCSHCAKIRNEEGEWEMVHLYLARNANIFFSHGVCPSCYLQLQSRFDPPSPACS